MGDHTMAGDGPAKPCVLVVEDEILVRMFAVDALQDAGFQVVQAGGGAEALSKLDACELCAVIIDLGLPDRRGDEIAAEIRQRFASLPILIASGRSERELKDRFADDSRIGILAKPYTEPMLLGALQTLGVAGNGAA